jgi:hypothetical protein
MHLAVLLAMLAAVVVSGLCLWQGCRARIREEQKNSISPPVAPHQLRWHITHIRDDISGIALLLGVTNALLAGILATLILR